MIVSGIDFGIISFSGCLFNTKSNSKKYISVKNTSYKEHGLKKELDPDLAINDFFMKGLKMDYLLGIDIGTK